MTVCLPFSKIEFLTVNPRTGYILFGFIMVIIIYCYQDLCYLNDIDPVPPSLCKNILVFIYAKARILIDMRLLNACTILKKVLWLADTKNCRICTSHLKDPRVNRSELSEIKMSFDVYRHAPPRTAAQMRLQHDVA